MEIRHRGVLRGQWYGPLLCNKGGLDLDLYKHIRRGSLSQWSIPAEQHYSGTPTGGSLNVLDSPVREQPPEAQPAREAGQQGRLQQAQGGSPAPDQHRTQGERGKCQPNWKILKSRSQAKRNKEKGSVERVNNGKLLSCIHINTYFRFHKCNALTTLHICWGW